MAKQLHFQTVAHLYSYKQSTLKIFNINAAAVWEKEYC